ncbi:hypothetical protein QYE76_045818 [Lolium multiflorum]|uniref:Protein kinase domain-containing protein n=1 Tax=Lolium multiflorum TaxID=4521 RepID=A0AAD8TLT3_LOLMU|nr:hypothetical protein QYE76_045818 [Lolium multiflorum]
MTVLNTNHILTFSCIVSSAVVILGRTCSCLQFTYPNFNTSQKDDFSFSPGSSITNGSLYITPNTGNISHQSGRVVYARETLKLWNSKQTSLTSFRTEFVLNILPQNGSAGEGMAFILTNNPSLPSNSSGQWLGVFNNQTDGTFENRVVDVEFDTRKSYKDDLDGNHVGIDIDSIKSVDQSPLSNQSIILSSGSDRRLAYRNLEKMIDAYGPVKFKLKELRRATANFSTTRKLGRGGFGTVYLGYISRMNLEVAVKRVSTNNTKSGRGEQEFITEVNTISKLSHRNLVKLIGWCHEEAELLLIYEYCPMGSLDKLLYASARDNMCVASALDYLHHGSSKRILHRDVKASNVMLDEDYNARLGDFGLAHVIQHDGVTHHSTQAVVGTRGYIAYETFFTGRASLDTDVYAFGVFIMEVVSGRFPSSSVSYRNQDEAVGRTHEAMYIVDWICRHYGEGKVLAAADTVLGGMYDEAQVDCAIRLAVACCHPNPRERPSMRTVVQVLMGGTPPPEPPYVKPAFVWPPSGNQLEIELPHVGLLFTGGQTSFCSMTSTSPTGR